MSPPPDDTPLRWTAGVKVVVMVFLALTLAYALLIAQQVLARVLSVVTVVVIWYAARLVIAMEGIVTQLGRPADERTNSYGRGDESN